MMDGSLKLPKAGSMAQTGYDDWAMQLHNGAVKVHVAVHDKSKSNAYEPACRVDGEDVPLWCRGSLTPEEQDA